MLQIKNICKQYVTGELVQEALNDVSLNLRDNEFVAVLGPSGSGKTTLLNVIGGLDRYDSGNLIINGISTEDYSDRDWDSYRNHTIGFVFQNYNLIPHQSILANVELALTISGISKSERKKRAKEALEEVGLGDQLHKKPNQMSGGQMQRVAIARALVNNPDILLADEPTGALDSETSVQVMELIKDIAKDRLVVMVTHNPELAERYANRIIKLHDGKITDDTNPFKVDESQMSEPEHKNMGKSSMSLRTALTLSFNNLRTKKARTILTSFAGSIGIIGIALILALSSGVNAYISDIQKDTMTSYPITIDAQTIDLSSIIQSGNNVYGNDEVDHNLDEVYSNNTDFEMVSSMTTSITENNLTKFKNYLDDTDSEIHQYIGENGIVYSYDTQFDVFTYDSEEVLVNTDGSTLSDDEQDSMMSRMSTMTERLSSSSSNNFEELLPGKDGEMVSSAVKDSYEVLYGSWPEEYNQAVLTLDGNNEISTAVLYELGILPSSEYKEIMEKIENGEEITLDDNSWSYEELCNQSFYMIPACDYYVENEKGLFDYIGDDEDKVNELLENAVKIELVGVIRPTEDSSADLISSSIGYTQALTDYIIDYTNESAVVKAQMANKDMNIISGLDFEPADDAAKIEDTIEYLSSLGVTEKAAMCTEILQAAYADDPEHAESVLVMSEIELANALDMYLQDPEDDVLLSIYDNYISPGSYDDNLSALGVISLDAPASISIYADTFEDKEAISTSIENYNTSANTEDQISYTDYVGLLMSSVTTIIDVISYVLIAFVSVSLVVSSIMIGIITFISVLERTKEIGILRAIGASKRNISQVFNAETFIIGLFSGLIGVGISCLLLIPGNAIIHAVAGTTMVNASLPVVSAVLLVALSMALTLIAGLIPAKKAAKKDPVTALRTE